MESCLGTRSSVLLVARTTFFGPSLKVGRSTMTATFEITSKVATSTRITRTTVTCLKSDRGRRHSRSHSGGASDLAGRVPESSVPCFKRSRRGLCNLYMGGTESELAYNTLVHHHLHRLLGPRFQEVPAATLFPGTEEMAVAFLECFLGMVHVARIARWSSRPTGQEPRCALSLPLWSSSGLSAVQRVPMFCRSS